MRRNRHSARRAAVALSSFVVCALAPFAARAEVSEDCSRWTLLPDFRCEQRTARPDDTFNVMGMPFLFEDPYITSGLNLVWVYHSFPVTSALGAAAAPLVPALPPGVPFSLNDGGNLNLLALQIRLALTDRLAFIATKDGVTFQSPGNPFLPEDDGFYDMTLGFKYALIDDRENGFILSPALRYEIPLGNEAVFQGDGDGVFVVSGSFAWQLKKLGLEHANFVGSLGGQIPVDAAAKSTSMFYNAHLDYGIPVNNSVVKFIVPFVELNGLYYTSDGAGRNNVQTRLGQLPVSTIESFYGSFEGVDVANLGAVRVDGNSLVILGGGIRVPTSWGVSFGAMFEGPVTSRRDIYGKRFTAMVTWEL
jgi:hypothetical protein